MADANEDLITRRGIVADEDVDLSDETQDFRFLAAISADGGKIPKRGEKDFEPHATMLQSDALAASRLAMHKALSIERYQVPKNHNLAVYHPETNTAYAVNPRGTWISKMGHIKPAGKDPLGDELRSQRLWLLPEEALYLIERGTLDIRWPATSEDDGLPMSLQAAYAMFIGDEASHDGALTFERYSVYTALRRVGYTVMRAPLWDGPGPALGQECFPPLVQGSWFAGLGGLLSFSWSDREGTSETGPMIGQGFFRSYSEIYRRLEVIQRYNPLQEEFAAQLPRTEAPFQITYFVYKPNNTRFRKTAPGPPDFRIAILDARKTALPTLDQLNRLMETVPYEPPEENKHFYAKLKHGYKNVILAVVDQGVTSYVRLFDAAFGQEKIYEHISRGPASKRGGHRGGRGRGRGRGR